MAYTWDFYTTGAVGVRACYRGPMIDVESQMSQPFSTMQQLELLRIRLLENIVDTLLDAVRTRECVLRVMNSDLAPVVARLYPQKAVLQSYICEKRRATEIEEDVNAFPISYEDGARYLGNFGVPKQTIDLLVAALQSHSPLLRVAGKSAVVLIASYIEMDA